jgi:membrane protein
MATGSEGRPSAGGNLGCMAPKRLLPRRTAAGADLAPEPVRAPEASERLAAPRRDRRVRGHAVARRLARYVHAFYVKAYSDNITGLSAMVAYNLLLSVFPLAALALFVFGRVLHNPDLERSVLVDLQELFPTTARSTLTDLLERIRASSNTAGAVALLSSVWFGSSFFGALDTAFCRLYHVRCRSWAQQKRFALAMLVLMLVFIAATVAVPAIQSLLVRGTEELPLGLSRLPGVALAVSLGVGLGVTFLILCLIYWAVPNRWVPWRAVWPGAVGATVAIGAVDYAFPFYLSNVSAFAGLGTTLIFVVILLLWFYALAFIILACATVNALRFERHDLRRGAA